MHLLMTGRRLAIAFAVAVLGSNTWALDEPREKPSPESSTSEALLFALRVPTEEKIVFRGVVSFDKAGTDSLNMLYPAPNAGAFVGSVIVHGLFVSAEKEEQKQKLQADADRVLMPYQDVLNGYSQAELMRQGFERVAIDGDKVLVGEAGLQGKGWLIETSPGFSMTQDQKAIILENAITILPPGGAPDAAYHNIIRVVSSPRSEESLVAYWTSNNGSALKDESTGLFAESLRIALTEAAGDMRQNNNPYKTYRYLEGDTERMERAQLVSEECRRLVIRTLRGWLMSIPQGPSVDSPSECQADGSLPQLAPDVHEVLVRSP